MRESGRSALRLALVPCSCSRVRTIIHIPYVRTDTAQEHTHSQSQIKYGLQLYSLIHGRSRLVSGCIRLRSVVDSSLTSRHGAAPHSHTGEDRSTTVTHLSRAAQASGFPSKLPTPPRVVLMGSRSVRSRSHGSSPSRRRRSGGRCAHQTRSIALLKLAEWTSSQSRSRPLVHCRRRRPARSNPHRMDYAPTVAAPQTLCSRPTPLRRPPTPRPPPSRRPSRSRRPSWPRTRTR